jgi:hypothetical protein
MVATPGASVLVHTSAIASGVNPAVHQGYTTLLSTAFQPASSTPSPPAPHSFSVQNPQVTENMAEEIATMPIAQSSAPPPDRVIEVAGFAAASSAFGYGQVNGYVSKCFSSPILPMRACEAASRGPPRLAPGSSTEHI